MHFISPSSTGMPCSLLAGSGHKVSMAQGGQIEGRAPGDPSVPVPMSPAPAAPPAAGVAGKASHTTDGSPFKTPMAAPAPPPPPPAAKVRDTQGEGAGVFLMEGHACEKSNSAAMSMATHKLCLKRYLVDSEHSMILMSGRHQRTCYNTWCINIGVGVESTEAPATRAWLVNIARGALPAHNDEDSSSLLQ